MKIVSFVLACLAGVTLVAVEAPAEGGSTARKGPFAVVLPVPGLKPDQREAVVAALDEVFGRHEAIDVTCGEGQLQFFFGGSGPQSLLRLGKLQEALGKLDLKLEPRSWVLEPQEVGLYLSAKKGMGGKALHKTLEAAAGGDAKVIGMLLDGSRCCLVLDVKKPLDLAKFEKALFDAGLDLEDFAWGHWLYGWEIGDPDEGHRHTIAARLRKP